MTREESVEMFNLLKASGVPIENLDIPEMQSWREWMTSWSASHAGIWLLSLGLGLLFVLVVYGSVRYMAATDAGKNDPSITIPEGNNKGLIAWAYIALVVFALANIFSATSAMGIQNQQNGVISLGTIKSLSAYYDIPEESFKEMLPTTWKRHAAFKPVTEGSEPSLVGKLKSITVVDKNGERTDIPNILFYNDGNNNLTIKVREGESSPEIPFEEVLQK